MPSEQLSPSIENLTLTSANTEYSLSTPDDCRHFSMQNRSTQPTRFAFTTGIVATPTGSYMTLKAGGVWNAPEKLFSTSALTVYLACSAAGTIVEALYWTNTE